LGQSRGRERDWEIDFVDSILAQERKWMDAFFGFKLAEELMKLKCVKERGRESITKLNDTLAGRLGVDVEFDGVVGKIQMGRVKVETSRGTSEKKSDTQRWAQLGMIGAHKSE